MLGAARARARLMGESIRRTKLMGNCKPSRRLINLYTSKIQTYQETGSDRMDFAVMDGTALCAPGGGRAQSPNWKKRECSALCHPVKIGQRARASLRTGPEELRNLALYRGRESMIGYGGYPPDWRARGRRCKACKPATRSPAGASRVDISAHRARTVSLRQVRHGRYA